MCYNKYNKVQKNVVSKLYKKIIISLIIFFMLKRIK